MTASTLLSPGSHCQFQLAAAAAIADTVSCPILQGTVWGDMSNLMPKYFPKVLNGGSNLTRM